MHDSRKTLLNVLIDNLFNIFNIATIILLVIFVINQSFVYIIPLAISLCVSIFSLILDFKNYIYVPHVYQRLHILSNGVEKEKSSRFLRKGNEVVLYPGDKIHFVGTVKSGFLFVDESSINGTTKLVKKEAGSSVIKGTTVIEGTGVVEVTELGRKAFKRTTIKQTELRKRIRLLNIIFSSIVLIVCLITFIFNKDNINHVAMCSITGTPYLLNIILVVFLFVKSKKENKNINVLDYSFLSELKDVDVVCLDKTGTLTTGEYEIFKTIVLSQTSLSAMSLDPNRGLEQAVSNIIKTTKENNGYYSTLQKHFDYDVTKIIESYSPLSQNGLYSAITVKGGKTYAIGEAEYFDLANFESAASMINEYESSGYRVLVLVESKNPLKSGLIDGKSSAIGLIILQETIRESVKELIKYCLENGKEIKVISGDKIATTSELCRKAGLENSGRATSIKSMPLEKVSLLLEQDVVFADATPSQKAFIVKELQKLGHKVVFIGNGDNDTQALKAANVAISLASGSVSAIKCSHASVNDDFVLTKAFIDYSKVFRNKLNLLTTLIYSQNAFSTFYLVAFLIASLVNKDIYNPFMYNQLMFWSIFGILIPSIVLLIDKGENLQPKHFLRNWIADSALLIAPIGIMYIIQLLQFNNVGYFGLPSDLNDLHETIITSSVVNNLSYLSLVVLSLVIVYQHLSPLNKFRLISFLSIVLLPIVYAVLLGLGIDDLSFITQISTKEITGINYFVMGVITVGCAAIYLFVLDIITTVKGEYSDVKSKSKN